MTCPCRGELCNGPKTDREIEAFATLAKAVSKTQNTRIKKRHIRQPRALLMHSNIVTAMQNNEEGTNDNTVIANNETINNENNNIETNDISERIKVSDIDEDMQSDQPAAENVEKDDSMMMKHNETNNVTTEIDQIKIEKTTKASHKNLEMTETITANHEDNNEHLDVTTVPLTKTTMIPMQTIMEMKPDLANNIKPSVPPAEALQQNSDSTMTSNKPEMTSSETMTDITTLSGIDTSPIPTRIGRNSGNVQSSSIFLIAYLAIKTI
ncbi:hypothetical protein ACJJTC_017268 [Scirpophaga incertulas]